MLQTRENLARFWGLKYLSLLLFPVFKSNLWLEQSHISTVSFTSKVPNSQPSLLKKKVGKLFFFLLKLQGDGEPYPLKKFLLWPWCLTSHFLHWTSVNAKKKRDCSEIKVTDIANLWKSYKHCPYAMNIYIHHIGYFSRTLIAALHFNDNTSRKQAETASGDPMWRVRPSRATPGTVTASERKTPATFGKFILFGTGDISVLWQIFLFVYYSC